MDKNRYVAEQLGIPWHGPKLCHGCRITRDDALTNPNASCNHDKSHNPDFATREGRVQLLELMAREDWQLFARKIALMELKQAKSYAKKWQAEVVKWTAISEELEEEKG